MTNGDSEAVALCRDFARAYDGVACDEIGRTVEDRPIVALASRVRQGCRPSTSRQASTPARSRARTPGSGSSAICSTARSLRARSPRQLVFVPVINPDGHERFGPNNRPNQRGPEEMGFRTNAARLNLNRDFVKADAPEITAVARRDPRCATRSCWSIYTRPTARKFEHDIAVLTSRRRAARGPTRGGRARALGGRCRSGSPRSATCRSTFYPSFVDDDQRRVGLRKGRGAAAVLAVLHGGAQPARRARRDPQLADVQGARAEHVSHAPGAVRTGDPQRGRVARRRDAATDGRTTALAGTDVTLVVEERPRHSTRSTFRGYAYDKRLTDITGGTGSSTTRPSRRSGRCRSTTSSSPEIEIWPWPPAADRPTPFQPIILRFDFKNIYKMQIYY